MIEFFILGLVLSGPLWVYSNTQGRGHILQIPLWMQQPWVSVLTAIYSLSLIVFIILAFTVNGFVGGLLDLLGMLVGATLGTAFIPHIIRIILYILYPLLAYLLTVSILTG